MLLKANLSFNVLVIIHTNTRGQCREADMEAVLCVWTNEQSKFFLEYVTSVVLYRSCYEEALVVEV